MNYFVAARIPQPEGLDEALADAPSRLRRLHPDDLHATVAFLGRMDHALVPELAAAVRAIPFGPAELRFGPLVALPSRRRPSAISFELAGPGHAELVALMTGHKGRLIELARARPDRYEPYPHVTVARPPRRSPPDLLRRVLAWIDAVEPPPEAIVARELVLFRSRPHDGRLFERVG